MPTTDLSGPLLDADDGSGGAAGSSGGDAGEDMPGSSGGSGGVDAGGDVPPDVGGAGGSAGSGGQDAGRDVGAGGSGGQDAARDVTVELPAPPCASTVDCPCETFAGHAYRYCRMPRSHSQAQANCVTLGMRLVRIDSDAENRWIFMTKNNHGFMTTWIGASDATTEGEWRWPDGVQFWRGLRSDPGAGPVGGLYNDWDVANGEPNVVEEDCAGFFATRDHWADLTCSSAESYVCEGY